MTFDVLQNTPQVAPLLVRLYDTHNLYALAENKGSDTACMELATVMVDLLNIRLSDRERELITDVMLSLMKQAQADLKVALSERLAAMDNIPLRIILGLANDDILVADPVLRNSPVLHDLDLIYILQAKGVSHGRAIAMRKGLSGQVVDMLVDTRDFEIAVNLSNNDGVALTQYAFAILSTMAQDSDILARPLLMRDDLPQDVAGKLYQFVSGELKKVMKQRYGIGADDAMAALDEITVELVDSAPPSEEEGQDRLVAYAHNQMRRGELKLSGIIASIRRGQFSTFLAQFSVYCSMPIITMRTALREESGKMLAIVCKASDIPKPDFVSLYLLTERFRSIAKRVVSHKELTRIMTMYDEINAEHARRVIRESRH